MQRLINIILLGCFAAAGGCSYGDWKLPHDDLLEPEAKNEARLYLEKNARGTLEYCVEADDPSTCSTYPNPGNCETLEVVINLDTGKTCEFCFDDEDNQKTGGCAYTNVACTVVTAPEPDCVVCAYVGGDVIYSTCDAADPEECIHYSDAGDPDGCEICYDVSGRPVINDCPIDCSAVACPEVLCDEGFEEIRSAGDCCPSCIPFDTCDEEVCAMSDYVVPDCPPGTELVRDPADCCYYYCAANSCPDEPNGPEDPLGNCPPEHYWVDEFPFCGQCIPEPFDDVPCLVWEDCGPEEYCTNEAGECLPDPDCPPEEEDCADFTICFGVCRPEWGCDPAGQGTLGDPLPPCEGELRFDSVDELGCPFAQCFCAGGIISVDGTCPDLCSDIYCSLPVTNCPVGEHLVEGYPNCCGICVPDGTCVPGEGGDPDGSGGVPVDNTMGCPEILCSPGFHPVIGPDCCEICERDEGACEEDPDCLPGETCVWDGVAAGFCFPSVVCFDSDGGIDPYTHGWLEGHDAWGYPYEMGDYCFDEFSVMEVYCFEPFNGSTASEGTGVIIECELGCIEGACVTSNPG